jgi:uncharacterized membrane protein YgcG
MTAAADDTADEAAFEAFLAGRAAPGGADDSFHAVAAFGGAVRATATAPGRPNAALAELLATGLLTDQSSPSTRTATSAGKSPRRSRVRRRRFAVFFPALLAKFLSAGAVAQAASGAGICLVAFTGAGVVGVLPGPVQDTFTSVVGLETSDEGTSQDDPAPTGDEVTSTDPGEVDGTAVETTAVPTAEPTVEELDPATLVAAGPAEGQTFGEWVSACARNAELRDWLRAEGTNFGHMVRDWAHRKGLDDTDLEEEGVDLDDLTEVSTPAPTTEAARTEAADPTSNGSDDRGNGRGNGNSNRHGGGSGGGGNSGGGNGRGHN